MHLLISERFFKVKCKNPSGIRTALPKKNYSDLQLCLEITENKPTNLYVSQHEYLFSKHKSTYSDIPEGNLSFSNYLLANLPTSSHPFISPEICAIISLYVD